MRTLCFTLIAVFAVVVRGAENGTEKVSSIDFKSEKSEIEFGRSAATDDFNARSDDSENVYYDDYEDENNEVSDRSETGKVPTTTTTTTTKTTTTSADESDGRETPTEVFLSEDGENFRTFKKRNDPTDLQASASDNVGVAAAKADDNGDHDSNGTAELGWNSRAYRDARYPLELSIVADEPVHHVLLGHQQHSSVDAPDLSDCARQGEWRPIGEIHIDSNQKDLQQEHDYLIPSGSHDVQQGGFGLYGNNFGSGEHSFHGFYGGGASHGSFAEFQKLTADAASAQSTHSGFDLNQHLQKYVAGSVSSYAPAFGGIGDGDGGGSGYGDGHKGTGGNVLSYSSDFGKIPLNHNFNGNGDHHGGGGHKFYHGQGNLLTSSGSGGYGKPKPPGLGSFNSGSSGGGAFLKGKPGGHNVRYAPGGFNFNRKPGPSAFGDGPGISLPPKGPFLRGKKPGNPWRSQKIKGGGGGGGGGGGFRRPNFDSLKSGPYLDSGLLGGSDSIGSFHAGSGSSGPFFGGHGGSGASGTFSSGHGGSSGAFLGDHGGSGASGSFFGGYRSPGSSGGHDGSGSSGHGGSGSSASLLGGHGGSGSSGAFLGGHGGSGSSGAFLGGHGGSGSSGAFLGGHGGSGSSGAFLGGHGGSGSSGAYLGGHGGSGSSGAYLGGHGGSGSSGAFLGGHGGSGSSGALLGGHGGSGSSGAYLGGHGGSSSAGVLLGSYGGSSEGLSAGHGVASGISGSLSGGYGDYGSSAALLSDHGGSGSLAGHGASGYSGINSYGGSSAGGTFGSFGGSNVITGHKGTVEGGPLLDNSLLSGHAENVALASALTDNSYIGQNVGHITHEAILQDASQLTSFTCGKNHDHGTNYHTASFQVSDADHGSQDVLQYQDGAHVIIHAANNGFEDVIHAERKQSEEGGDSSASATKESSLEIITGSAKSASNHRYAEGGNNDENSGTSDQIEEPTSHSYYRDKFPSTENSPIQFEYSSDSEKPQIIKELEELSSRFQLDLDNARYTNGKGVSYETFFGEQENGAESPNPVIHNGYSIVNVNDFDINPKDEGYRYEEYQNEGDVITEYPYYTVHQDRESPENLPVVINEHHPHKGDKPKTHIPPKRKHPGKQYEVHENSGEKQIPTTEIFPPQKFPRQFHNPMPNLAGRPPKESSKYLLSPPYGSYPILPSVPFKKYKKYKLLPGKLKYRRPVLVRRPIPITSAPVVRVSVSS